MSVFDLFRLSGRRALITGGSRGLGRAIAQAFAEAGAELVLVARDAERLATAREELAATGVRVETRATDASDLEAADAMCSDVLTRIGPIDILVNNIGGRRENIATESMPLDKWRQLVDLNLTSAFVCTKRFGEGMLTRRWGRVINIASICGQIATRGITGRHYETAKAGLVGFTKAVAADWAPHGVTVNAIAPGAFLTDPNRRWFAERPEFRTEIEAQIPMGRPGDPAEIGPLALYLASEASRYMTGSLLVIDGGYTLW
jgi:gluconate 5-dehydrogenase